MCPQRHFERNCFGKRFFVSPGFSAKIFRTLAEKIKNDCQNHIICNQISILSTNIFSEKKSLFPSFSDFNWNFHGHLAREGRQTHQNCTLLIHSYILRHMILGKVSSISSRFSAKKIHTLTEMIQRDCQNYIICSQSSIFCEKQFF